MSIAGDSSPKNTPSEVYINGINLSGLWFKKPRKAKWDANLKSYWESSGNFDAQGLGMLVHPYHITFAGTKDEAIIWTEGVLATMKMLSEWTK